MASPANRSSSPSKLSVGSRSVSTTESRATPTEASVHPCTSESWITGRMSAEASAAANTGSSTSARVAAALSGVVSPSRSKPPVRPVVTTVANTPFCTAGTAGAVSPVSPVSVVSPVSPDSPVSPVSAVSAVSTPGAGPVSSLNPLLQAPNRPRRGSARRTSSA